MDPSVPQERTPAGSATATEDGPATRAAGRGEGMNVGLGGRLLVPVREAAAWGVVLMWFRKARPSNCHRSAQ